MENNFLNTVSFRLYYDDDEPDIDEDSRLAVATVWGIPWGRRGSQGQPTTNTVAKQAVENKDRIALDISLLKKQYDRLRERQKQAHIILTTACSTASRPATATNTGNVPLAVNQLLSGRPAIITNKGRRNGPPLGAIPPARKPSLPAVLQDKPLEKQLRRGETLHWRDTKDIRNRRDSLSWKEIKAERAAMISSGSIEGLKSQKIRSVKLGKSDSSSYSEESDENEPDEEGEASSTDTSLCDEELQPVTNGVKKQISSELNKESSGKSLYKQKKNTFKQRNHTLNTKDNLQKIRPKSWAPSNSEIPFVLMTTDSPTNSADENTELDLNKTIPSNNIIKVDTKVEKSNLDWKTSMYLPIDEDLVNSEVKVLSETLPISYEENSLIGDLTKNKNTDDGSFIDSGRTGVESKTFDISNEGVTNEYFERVNSTERPTKLDLLYSLNEDENVRDSLEIDNSVDKFVKTNEKLSCMDLLVDYSEKSSVACIEEAKTEISATFQTGIVTPLTSLRTDYNGTKTEHILKKPKGSAEKRRDPRRLTLTRSSTMDIEKRYQALEKRLSMEVCSKYKRFSTENDFNVDDTKESHERFIIKPYSTYKYDNNDNDSRIQENSICVEKKKIPSTADLEERFKNIQQQLVKDRKQILISPCDSENTGKQSNSKSTNSINSPTSHNEKNIGKARKLNDNDEDEKTEDSKTILSDRSNIKDNASITVETEKTVSNDNDDIEQSTLKSDSDATTSKSNTLPSKKEPPDDGDLETKEESSNDLSKTLEAEIPNEGKQDLNTSTSPSRDDSQTKSPDKSPKKAETEIKINAAKSSDKSDETLESKENKHITDSNISNSKASNETLNEDKQKDSTSKSGRTSPPSTEELERRFSALEEKMSSAKNVSSEQKQEIDNNIKQEKHIKEEANITSDETEISSNNNESLTTDLTKFKNINENSSKRRLSEPPSTEDLEKRYEVLKRRMSSRNFETKTLHREGHSNVMQSTKKAYNEETPANTEEKIVSQQTQQKISPPSTENLEKRFEKLQNNSETKVSNHKESPPSTENLEKRFEKLQSKNDIQRQSIIDEPDAKENINKTTNLKEQTHSDNLANTLEKPTKSTNKEEQTTIQQTAENQENIKENVKEALSDSLKKKPEQIKLRVIEELQAKIKEHSKDVDIETNVKKKNALIDELKTKLKPLPNDIVKPTQISSKKRVPIQNVLLPSQSFNDETLESHATSAYRKSGNYEPKHIIHRKMVRRFSDLPSRADLENRLQFLEEQLSKTVNMQRRSSDSEVASKSHYKLNTTLPNVPLNEGLELRVRELEKRLKENTTLSMDIACTNKNDGDVEISQTGGINDAVAVTGKELVRYSSYGEVGDIEHQNPINISINIQMTLNKDDSTNKNNTTDLDKRLQYLEEQLKSSRVQESSEITTPYEKLNFKEEDTKSFTNINKSDVNETGDKDKIEEKSDAKDSCETVQEISQHHKEDKSDLKLEENIPTKENPEVRQEECNTDEAKHQETDEKTDHCTIEKDDLSQLKTIKDMENIKTAETKVTDEAKEVKEEQKQLEKPTAVIEKQNMKDVDNKGLDNHKSQDITSVEETEECKMINAQTEKKEISLKENKNDLNSAQTKMESSQITEKDKIVKEKCDSNTRETIDGSEMNKKSEIEKSNILSNTTTQFVPVEVNKKTLVLLLDNEPKAVKVRRLTRANTEELEDLFQALEKQLNDRSQVKLDEKKTKQSEDPKTTEEMSNLAKEIEKFSKTDLDQMEHSDKNSQKTRQQEKQQQQEEQEEFDWGKDPIKYHLKKRTVYLPSTKELEARFRSLERQIKLLEDVEKIDVEQRLVEIERKIKLQYSLSHEKDLNKFLELCEGKDVDDMPSTSEKPPERRECNKEPPPEQKCATRHISPNRSAEPIPSTGNLEYRYRSLELKRSRSKQNLKKQPIHPLEMLLDPSPDDNDIPTTGELEHRMRVMEEKRYTPSPPSRKSHSQSPAAKTPQGIIKPTTHIVDSITSPTERGLPTAEELEARLEALEREQCFNFKMQKNFQQFNQKLKDVVSPSLSFDEIKPSTKPHESEHTKTQTAATVNPIVSPKTIRFREVEKPQAYSLNDKEATVRYKCYRIIQEELILKFSILLLRSQLQIPKVV